MLSQPVAKKPKHNKKLIKKGEKALEVAFNALQYAGTLTVAFAFSSVGLENIVAYLPEILPLGVAIGLIKSYFDERRKKREAMGKGITEPITPAFSENKFLEHSVNFAATAAGLSILINLLDGFSLQLPWLAIVSGCAGIAYGGIRTLTEGHYKEHFKSTRENSDDWNNDSEY